MPELPEVECTRRHIAGVLRGARVAGVAVHRDRMVRRNARPSDVVERLSGRVVEAVGRRGKFIVCDVEDGFSLVIHLGMSGRLRVAAGTEAHEKHANVVISLDSGVDVRLVDPRTFGFVAVLTPEEWDASPMALLGRDAFDDLPDPTDLAAAFSSRSAPIKAVLLDQRVVAGLGNIYADEVLIRSAVHPRRPANGLGLPEVERLHSMIGPVLAEGIAHGGTSLDDLAYLLPDGRAGEHMADLWAYGRTGEPCRVCGTAIERTTVAQRSSHFCPHCQRVS
ncbi:MAG: bifunctional DNA-formamidopyrimidine glycosylase/DNA-(apurinic or apyrimidinic site) lyase [Acidimicrobiia bacterium]|nr:bifunctional DNA-formamidopyrimidine glycosylase/DNA-(apurinic or apyrimidinic site) lyase [Acidimicrobiia bacterium]MDH4308027.1 bifunctional DNA-formamidopyrimidine glycosylase/DNA-(apurinic or apyrimidinic site) lyase [Acidimicrobiia bacterium]MDH5292714.1 bifunctional DNA-formamidopyrimidine glycosylase/DNA-(apurinic or apyrimidinic site) lyase [Acidimicrobiia bacterium]